MTTKYLQNKAISTEELIELLNSLDGYGIVFEDEGLVRDFLNNESFFFRHEPPVTEIMITLEGGCVTHVAANQEVEYRVFGEDERPYKTYEADQIVTREDYKKLLDNSLDEWAEENDFDLSELHDPKSGLTAEEENEVNLEDRQADEFRHLKDQYSEDTGDEQ